MSENRKALGSPVEVDFYRVAHANYRTELSYILRIGARETLLDIKDFFIGTMRFTVNYLRYF